MTWSWAGRLGGNTVVWWPASLPSVDGDPEPLRRPRRPVKRPMRRGRIQLIAA
jgi:hypothetical protein